MCDEKKKKGRPLSQSIQDSPMDNYNVRLTSWHARILRKMGDGNLAAGIRYAAEFVLRNRIDKE
jgi:hypothetical protein